MHAWKSFTFSFTTKLATCVWLLLFLSLWFAHMHLINCDDTCDLSLPSSLLLYWTSKPLSYSECMNLLARSSSIGYVVSTHNVTMHLLYSGISLWHQQTSCSKVGVAVRVAAVVRVNTSQSPAFIQMKMASQDLEASKSEWMAQVMYETS